MAADFIGRKSMYVIGSFSTRSAKSTARCILIENFELLLIALEKLKRSLVFPALHHHTKLALPKGQWVIKGDNKFLSPPIINIIGGFLFLKVVIFSYFFPT